MTRTFRIYGLAMMAVATGLYTTSCGPQKRTPPSTITKGVATDKVGAAATQPKDLVPLENHGQATAPETGDKARSKLAFAENTSLFKPDNLKDIVRVTFHEWNPSKDGNFPGYLELVVVDSAKNKINVAIRDEKDFTSGNSSPLVDGAATFSSGVTSDQSLAAEKTIGTNKITTNSYGPASFVCADAIPVSVFKCQKLEITMGIMNPASASSSPATASFRGLFVSRTLSNHYPVDQLKNGTVDNSSDAFHGEAKIETAEASLIEIKSQGNVRSAGRIFKNINISNIDQAKLTNTTPPMSTVIADVSYLLTIQGLSTEIAPMNSKYSLASIDTTGANYDIKLLQMIGNSSQELVLRLSNNAVTSPTAAAAPVNAQTPLVTSAQELPVPAALASAQIQDLHSPSTTAPTTGRNSKLGKTSSGTPASATPVANPVAGQTAVQANVVQDVLANEGADSTTFAFAKKDFTSMDEGEMVSLSWNTNKAFVGLSDAIIGQPNDTVKTIRIDGQHATRSFVLNGVGQHRLIFSAASKDSKDKDYRELRVLVIPSKTQIQDYKIKCSTSGLNKVLGWIPGFIPYCGDDATSDLTNTK